jgi:hypothetical protein
VFDVSAIAHAALRGLPGARGELDIDGRRLVLSGGPVLQVLVSRRPGGGVQLHAACPGCGRRVARLYLDGPGLRCRVCARLTLPSCRNRTEDRAVPLALARVARERERIGADPTPGAPLPSKLRHWSRAAWELRIERIRAAEAALQAAIDAAVARGRAKLASLSEPGDGGGSYGEVSASRDGGSRGRAAKTCQDKSTQPRKQRPLAR